MIWEGIDPGLILGTIPAVGWCDLGKQEKCLSKNGMPLGTNPEPSKYKPNVLEKEYSINYFVF